MLLHLRVAATPDAAALAAAVQILSHGGVVAIPTDTLYGLAADPRNRAAVDRVFAVKGRAAGQALPLVAADLEQVVATLGALTPIGARLAAQFWPGPLTLVMTAPAHLAPSVTAESGTIGVRVPDLLVTRALCEAYGHPLTATSANRSGEPPTPEPDEVVRSLGETLDGILDAGRTAGGPPSTLIDVRGEVPVLLRAGAISWKEIEACLHNAP